MVSFGVIKACFHMSVTRTFIQRHSSKNQIISTSRHSAQTTKVSTVLYLKVFHLASLLCCICNFHSVFIFNKNK